MNEKSGAVAVIVPIAALLLACSGGESGNMANVASTPRAGTGLISISATPAHPTVTKGSTQQRFAAKAVDVASSRVVSPSPSRHDRKPTLTIAAPLDYAVGRPRLRLAASCVDDDPAGCASLKVTKAKSLQQSDIAAGKTAIDETVSFAGDEGYPLTLRFQAADSAGQVSTEYRTVFIDSSAKLVELLGVNGIIWDVRPDRVLFLAAPSGAGIWRPPSGDPSGRALLQILDRSSGAVSVVMNRDGITPQYGFLTPKGAIFVAQSGDFSTSRVYDWRDGVLIDLGPPNSWSSLKVNGNYAIWNRKQLLIMRNLTNGNNTIVSEDAANWRNDIAANGVVSYWRNSTYQIYRYAGGVTTQMTHDAMSNVYPLTDGANVIYRKRSPRSNQAYQVALNTRSGESILSPASPREPTPDIDYQMNGGWAAFTRIGRDGVSQVWRRSPAGDLAQLSFLGADSRIEVLGSNGDVMWISGNHRYLSSSGAMPVDIGSSLGKSFFQGGQWYVSIGRSLFRVVP